MNLGSFDKGVTIKTARQAANKARALVSQGVDPIDKRDEEIAVERERVAKAKTARKEGTIKDLFELYVQGMRLDGKRSADQVWYSFEKDIKPTIGDRVAKGLSRRELADVVDAVYERGAATLANRVRSYLVAAYNFGLKFEGNRKFASARRKIKFRLEYNPALAIERDKTAERAGKRFLNGPEIKHFWSAAGATLPNSESRAFNSLMEIAVKMVLASGGQRVLEILRARWDEIDEEMGLWRIPPEHIKTRRYNLEEHIVPIGSVFNDLIQELKATRRNDFLFPCRTADDRHMPFSSLSSRVAAFCRSGLWKPRKPFSARDLRRTAKTLMGERGISKDTRDRLQNHAIPGVSAKHYDKWTYLDEKRAAMAVWDSWIRSCLDSNADKADVVPIRSTK